MPSRIEEMAESTPRPLSVACASSSMLANCRYRLAT